MKYTDISKQRNMMEKRSNNKGLIKFILLLVVLGVIGGSLYLFKDRIKLTFNPVSIVSNVAAANLTETDGRINILVLGSDKRDYGAESGRILTDTMMIVSIGTVDDDIVMISLPRDLWISNYNCTTDICNGALHNSGKLNSVYEFGGADEIKRVVQEVTDVPIHYHILVTFDIFKQAIDVLGNIDVNVENAFTDNYYPIEGKEVDTCGKSQTEVQKLIEEIEKNTTSTEKAFPCRFKTITFNTGLQSMDSEVALEFARSRHATGDEGTDFARAKRQQKVIVAIKDKALSVQTLLNPTKIRGLYDAYISNVDTNIDFQTIENFILLAQKLDFSKVTSVVLDDRSDADNGGLLYNPADSTLYGGAWVLIPQTGNFSQIHAYVQKYLFGDK